MIDTEKIDTRRIGIEILVIPMFITGILVIFTNLPILIISGISFLLGIIIAAIDFWSKLEKPPTPSSATPETPTQKTETKFPATLKTVITLIIIGAIIWFAIIPVVIPFISNHGDSSSKKTANAEKAVTVIIYANGGTCAITPFFEKGQTIVITATGSVTGSTNRNHWAYGYVGPTGWITNPNLQGKKPSSKKDSPFMSLIGYFREKRNGGYFSTEEFYIGREISIITERAGTKEICFTPNEIKDGAAYRDAFKTMADISQ